MFFFFLTSGLFLGWSLGANDAANIFGTAVGSKMIRFRTAALVAGIFVILGATLQGGGTTETLNRLGSVDAIAGAFTVALSAGLVIFFMVKNVIPVSTTQAIVGAIVGWNLFTGHKTDTALLTTIVSTWVAGPVLGALFAALTFVLLRMVLKKLQIHLILLDIYIKWALLIVGAFGAYSLGANNIANVMGVFITAAPPVVVDFGIFSMESSQLLLMLGGIAIATGIFTYSKKLMMKIGSGIMDLSAVAAIAAVFAQAVVLFIFSSSSLSEMLKSLHLPPIPLVPVSSSQVIVGAIMGIGLVKGVNEIRFKPILGIVSGWVLTPILTGLLSFLALFFMKNLFNLHVGTEVTSHGNAGQVIAPAVIDSVSGAARHINLAWLGIIAVTVIVMAVMLTYSYRQQKRRLTAERELLEQEKENNIATKALADAEIKSIQYENQLLKNQIENNRKELVNYALNIAEQKEYLEMINKSLKVILNEKKPEKRDEQIRRLEVDIRQRMSFANKMEDFNLQSEKIHKDFIGKLTQMYPSLSANDVKLAVLLRLGVAGKEIATLLTLSPKSVEINRYRLRKKLGLDRRTNLVRFLNNI